MKRIINSLVAMTVLVTTLAAFTCTKNQVLANAGFALDSLRSAAPLVEQFLPGSKAKLEYIIPIAQKIKDAVAANNATDAVAFLRQLIPVFDDIIQHDIHGLSTDLQTQILAALALADIGFSFLANFYLANLANPVLGPPGALGAGLDDVIIEFARKPVWGKAYKR